MRGRGAQVEIWPTDRGCQGRHRVPPPPTGVWPTPDDEARLFAAFPEADFAGATFGELVVFRRRPTDAEQSAGAVPLRLLPTLPETRPYALRHVGEDAFRFYRFDHAGLQLAPNEPNTPAATIAFPLTLRGHSRFVCQVGADAGNGRSVTCHLTVRRADGHPW
jgi:hypothetical protein